MKRLNWGMILVILGTILFWVLLVGLVFGQEAGVNCPPPPPPPDCDVIPLYFRGHVIPYMKDGAQKYYVALEWATDRRSGDGYWEIMKAKRIVLHGRHPLISYHEKFKVLKTEYLDGRWTEFAHDDYFTARGVEYFYLLRWVCGNCGEWEYYGAVHLTIPRH